MTVRVTHFDDDVEDLAVDLFYKEEENKQRIWERVGVAVRMRYRAQALEQMESEA